jgi:creatinine amidohydrolase
MMLADMTWSEVARRPGLILLLPLGATEQHGPHLPLDTDTVIVRALVEAAARVRDDLVLAPLLPYGSSGEHAAFPGTLSLGQAALELALLELARSADHFAALVLVCWHGGNRAVLKRVSQQLTREGRRVRVWQPAHLGLDLHAGRTETSLMLLLDPGRVREERPEGSLAALDVIEPVLRREGVAAISSSGVLGDAHGASRELGQRIFEGLVDDLCRFLSEGT